MMSMDKIQMNIQKIKEQFPNAVTEVLRNGKPALAVDFDILKQELSDALIDEREERYQFTWPDKRKSVLLANSPISATLRPCREESVNFDTTQNLYIEGDNLDVLKLLQETYLGKIKMIYIDPPYNTRKDLVYRDNFDIEEERYLTISGNYDDEGNRLFHNKETNGRFHTDWLNMLYPRIKVAKDLLSNDGIIFISIDDNEVDNLRKICDEIFSENNFVAQIVIDGTPKNDPIIVSTAHEYCLVYVKNNEVAKQLEWGVKNPIYEKLLNIVVNANSFLEAERLIKQFYKDNNLDDDNISNYNKVDEYGLYRIGPIDDPQGGGARDTRYNPFTNEALKTPQNGWRCSLDTWNTWIANHEIIFPKDNTKLCSRKVYMETEKLDLLRAYFKIQTRKDTDMLKNMFGKKVFQFPKPVELIKTFIDNSIKEEGIVIDFFSGSATTAQATIQLNAERGNNNVKFILVQIRENLEENMRTAQGNREKQTAQNAIDFCKTNNLPLFITEIAKERIRRAGKKVKEENSEKAKDLDIGFRVLKLDSSNMKDVYYRPEQYRQSLLEDLGDNIKEDRTPLDLLFQVMLELGKPLSAKIEEKDICGKHIFIVDENDLIACFDVDVTAETVKAIALLKPLYAVFRDSSLADDAVGSNFDQIFATYSPNTTRKVL